MDNQKLKSYGIYKSKYDQLCMSERACHYQKVIRKGQIVQVESINVGRHNLGDIKFVSFKYTAYDSYIYIPTDIFKKSFKLIDDTLEQRLDDIDKYIEDYDSDN